MKKEGTGETVCALPSSTAHHSLHDALHHFEVLHVSQLSHHSPPHTSLPHNKDTIHLHFRTLDRYMAPLMYGLIGSNLHLELVNLPLSPSLHSPSFPLSLSLSPLSLSPLSRHMQRFQSNTDSISINCTQLSPRHYCKQERRREKTFSVHPFLQRLFAG